VQTERVFSSQHPNIDPSFFSQVEFPAIAQTNKISDGSASSQAIVRRANVEFNTKVCSALASRGQRVVVLCSEGSTLQAMLEARLPARAVCGLVKDAGGMGITRGDVVVSCQPADAAAWMTCAGKEPGRRNQLSAPRDRRIPPVLPLHLIVASVQPLPRRLRSLCSTASSTTATRRLRWPIT